MQKENLTNGWNVIVQTRSNRNPLLLILLVSFSQYSGNGRVPYYLHDILNSVGIKSSYYQSMIERDTDQTE